MNIDLKLILWNILLSLKMTVIFKKATIFMLILICLLNTLVDQRYVEEIQTQKESQGLYNGFTECFYRLLGDIYNIKLIYENQYKEFIYLYFMQSVSSITSVLML